MIALNNHSEDEKKIVQVIYLNLAKYCKCYVFHTFTEILSYIFERTIRIIIDHRIHFTFYISTQSRVIAYVYGLDHNLTWSIIVST